MSKDMNFISIFDSHAENYPNKPACVFFDDQPIEQHTYITLQERAKAIATVLQHYNVENERVLILLPQGLEYIASFLACLYVGAIAIPAYPPIRTNLIDRIRAITTDAQPKFIIAESKVLTTLSACDGIGDIPNLHLIDVKQIEHHLCSSYKPIVVKPDQTAFLQYSSGSTGDPKGVMVSHENIVTNLQMMQAAFKQNHSSVFVSWIPLFHDMGLIAATLLPLYLGATLYFMPTFSFIKKPIRWLKAISQHRGTISFAPDFGYKLCADSINDTEKLQLDLSSWQVAVSGSEPIRKETLEAFAEKFTSCGFKRQALCPGYGLAEATVFVAASPAGRGPIYTDESQASLSQPKLINHNRTLVECGRTLIEEEIHVVSPDDFNECQPGDIGEIWISGKHVAKGYWGKKELSLTTFQAYTATGKGPFLRTGDLGFLDKERGLFIVGRMKDIIIIAGKNHAALDIEETTRRSHPEILEKTVVAVSIEHAQQEQLIIFIGVKGVAQVADFPVLTKSVKKAIYEVHDITPYKVLFVRQGVIPKTTSGKLQRQKIREIYLSGNLALMAD